MGRSGKKRRLCRIKPLAQAVHVWNIRHQEDKFSFLRIQRFGACLGRISNSQDFEWELQGSKVQSIVSASTTRFLQCGICLFGVANLRSHHILLKSENVADQVEPRETKPQHRAHQ